MINRIIRHLIYSDITLFFSIGLLAPIFAIFVTQNIQGGSLEVVGLAASTYWVARTITTVPLSRIMDRTKGEKDEYYFMLFGSYVMTLIPFLYIYSSQPWHIYLLGFINGSAASMAVPGWRILFTNHLDRGSTGYEWSIEDVGVGIAIALSSYLGAFLAETFGFQALFVLITAVGVLGVTIFLIPLRKDAEFIRTVRHRGKLISRLPPQRIDSIK